MFQTITPEKAGISSKEILRFLKILDKIIFFAIIIYNQC